MPKNRVIDVIKDTDYYTEVRTLLGITDEELSDAILKSDIVLGTAERAVCGTYVDNWVDVLNGSDAIAEEALRSCVIIKVCLNILETPSIQNLLIDQVRLVDIIITAKKITVLELKQSLNTLFEQQLALVGVVHTGDYPEKEIIGKSDAQTPYEYYVDDDGNIQEQ